MASYWDRQAYEAKKTAVASQTSALTPEAPISFAGMGQSGGGVPTVGFNQAAYAAQQKSAAEAPATKIPKTPKAPKPVKAPPEPQNMNKKQRKKYTATRLGIKTTYSEPKNTETVVAKSNTGRLRVPTNAGLMGKSSLVIKKAI